MMQFHSRTSAREPSLIEVVAVALAALTLAGVWMHVSAERGLRHVPSPSVRDAARVSAEALSRADEAIIRDMLLHD